MTIEEAIKKAVEGGWKKSDGWEFEGYDPEYREKSYFQSFSGGDLYDHDILNSETFLDPAFWQSLGKALEWSEKEITIHHKSRTVSVVVKPGGSRTFKVPAHDVKRIVKNQRWKKEWHNFIDHLAAGNDAESFFKGLH
jgi:hypothetical protein